MKQKTEDYTTCIYCGKLTSGPFYCTNCGHKLPPAQQVYLECKPANIKLVKGN